MIMYKIFLILKCPVRMDIRTRIPADSCRTKLSLADVRKEMNMDNEERAATFYHLVSHRKSS